MGIAAGVALAVLLLAGGMQTASAEDVDCSMCHPDLAKKKVVHAAVSMGCPTCHASLNATEMPHKVTGNVPKGLSSAAPDLCYGCHDKGAFSKKNVHAALVMGCSSCHNPHSSDNAKLLVAEVPNLCFTCHDKAQFSKKNVHAPVAGGMCLSCHSPHAADEMALLLKRPTAVCAECHADVLKKKHVVAEFRHPVGSVAKQDDNQQAKSASGKKDTKAKGPMMDPARPEKEFYCGSCHNPHSSDFKRLMRYKAGTPFELCINCHKK
jgi:predicted CXXCH cytochrome family protein